MKFITLSCILSGNKPPKDHSVERQEFMMIPLPLIIIMWLMAAVGIVCSLGFLHFNISNGKSRYDIYRRDILIYAKQQKRICLEDMSKVFKTSDIRCFFGRKYPFNYIWQESQISMHQVSAVQIYDLSYVHMYSSPFTGILRTHKMTRSPFL